MESPCKNCENKGCGSYHDKCLPYLRWREIQKADQKNSDPEYKKRRPWR